MLSKLGKICVEITLSFFYLYKSTNKIIHTVHSFLLQTAESIRNDDPMFLFTANFIEFFVNIDIVINVKQVFVCY